MNSPSYRLLATAHFFARLCCFLNFLELSRIDSASPLTQCGRSIRAYSWPNRTKVSREAIFRRMPKPRKTEGAQVSRERKDSLKLKKSVPKGRRFDFFDVLCVFGLTTSGYVVGYLYSKINNSPKPVKTDNVVGSVERGHAVGSVARGHAVGSVARGHAVGSVARGHAAGSVERGRVVESVARGGAVESVERGGAVESVERGRVVESVARGGAVESVERGGAVEPVERGGAVESVKIGDDVESVAMGHVVKLLDYKEEFEKIIRQEKENWSQRWRSTNPRWSAEKACIEEEYRQYFSAFGAIFNGLDSTEDFNVFTSKFRKSFLKWFNNMYPIEGLISIDDERLKQDFLRKREIEEKMIYLFFRKLEQVNFFDQWVAYRKEEWEHPNLRQLWCDPCMKMHLNLSQKLLSLQEDVPKKRELNWQQYVECAKNLMQIFSSDHASLEDFKKLIDLCEEVQSKFLCAYQEEPDRWNEQYAEIENLKKPFSEYNESGLKNLFQDAFALIKEEIVLTHLDTKEGQGGALSPMDVIRNVLTERAIFLQEKACGYRSFREKDRKFPHEAELLETQALALKIHLDFLESPSLETAKRSFENFLRYLKHLDKNFDNPETVWECYLDECLGSVANNYINSRFFIKKSDIIISPDFRDYEIFQKNARAPDTSSGLRDELWPHYCQRCDALDQPLLEQISLLKRKASLETYSKITKNFFQVSSLSECGHDRFRESGQRWFSILVRAILEDFFQEGLFEQLQERGMHQAYEHDPFGDVPIKWQTCAHPNGVQTTCKSCRQKNNQCPVLVLHKQKEEQAELISASLGWIGTLKTSEEFENSQAEFKKKIGEWQSKTDSAITDFLEILREKIKWGAALVPKDGRGYKEFSAEQLIKNRQARFELTFKRP